jgi:hypothetical protein
MNKIKALYDIAKTMSEKDLVSGTFRAELLKDQDTVFQMDNDFSRDKVSGTIKAKILTQANYEGKSFKHESCTEFTHPGDLHHHQHGCRPHPHFEHFHHHGAGGHGGLKGVWSGLALALDFLNKTNVEEQPDHTLLITFQADEIPKELLNKLCQKLEAEHGHEHSHEHLPAKESLKKELQALQNANLQLVSRINPNNEIEHVEITLNGKKTGEDGETNSLVFKAQVTLR